jgi:ankyrin repeat protein
VHDTDKAYVGDGRTALHQAAANGNTALIKLLLSCNADVNARNASGETPLHLAARFGHIDSVRDLVAAHARVNELTIHTKATPLMSAAEMGQTSVIRLLMASGANKTIKDAFGKTPPERYKEYMAKLLPHVATPSRTR